MRNKRGIHCYTDGGARPNPGNGAYGWVAIDVELNQFIEQKAQKIYDTTNNICEMTAVYSVLLAVVQNSWEDVVIYTDSQYVHKGLTIWAEGWERKDFKDVKNAELWRGMYALYKQLYYRVKIEWVKGHAGNIWNEYVDELVTATILGKGQPVVKVEKPKNAKIEKAFTAAKKLAKKQTNFGKPIESSRKQIQEGIQEHIERYDETPEEIHQVEPGDDSWSKIVEREWTPELVQQFNEVKLLDTRVGEQFGDNDLLQSAADLLLLQVYKAYHRDKLFQGSHGLLYNITEYLQSRKLI